MNILRGKFLALAGFGFAARLGGVEDAFGLLLELVQADGGLEHEQHIKALAADVLDNSGDVFRFGDGFVDGFSQLLNESAQLGVQLSLRFHPALWPQGALNFLTLLLKHGEGNRSSAGCYTLSRMEPNTVGKKLGVGVRVASKMLMERASQGAPEPAATSDAGPQRPPAASHQVYAARGKAVAKGSRKFGEAVWRPFVHASGVLWLEVTGLFFGIFTLFFATNAYKLRQEWKIGPDHQRFVVYTVVTLIFAYFTFSSFYRARRKERIKRQAGR